MSTITASVKSDREIQQDILKELVWDPRVDSTEVGVQVDRGVVALSGTISSYAKKVAAKEAAHRVAGVLDVVNDLIVSPPNAYVQTDEDIARAIRQALKWDILIPEERIHSTVARGVVTLEGEVATRAQRADAERAVERLTGVKGVDNRLTVKPTVKVSAQKIRSEIESALDRQAHREANRIGIIVEEGVVTLTGTVHSWAERNAIHNTVMLAPGVRHVQNRLLIEPYA